MAKPNITYTKLLNYKQPYVVIPSKVIILDYPWTVRIHKDLKNKGKSVNGLCDYAKRLISLSEKSPDLLRTFHHECRHAFNHELGWTNTETVVRIESEHSCNIYYQTHPNGQQLTDSKLDEKIKHQDKQIKELRRKLNGKKQDATKKD